MSERSKRVAVRVCAVAVLMATALGGWVIYQNDYAITERRVVIDAETPLHAVLAMPRRGAGPHGVVVFVHGDGPIDATHDTFYRPIWEVFADAGFASLSWDKPGVDGAPGDWLEQDMDDRATEVETAIDWARHQPGLDGARIGLWGASQAGWVMPKVAAQAEGIRFVVAVSPAINWLRQGEFNTRAELSADGASPAELADALRHREATLRYIRDGSSFDVASAAGAAAGMTPQRWRFVQRNFRSDASADLTRVRVPTLLLLGGHDVNVDVADTEAGYRVTVPRPDLLTVRTFPSATHSMVPAWLERHDALLTLVAIAAPRSVYAPGVLDAIRDFAAGAGRRPS